MFWVAIVGGEEVLPGWAIPTLGSADQQDPRLAQALRRVLQQFVWRLNVAWWKQLNALRQSTADASEAIMNHS